MSEQDYIANCIDRILSAPCLPANHYRRSKDLAGVVRIAGHNTVNAGHAELQNLVELAEAGRYNMDAERPLLKSG